MDHRDCSNGLHLAATTLPPNALLRLPREVRNQILEHAFGDDVRVFLLDGYVLSLHKGRPSPDNSENDDLMTDTDVTNRLPQWLLSCKQICAEGIGRLRRADQTHRPRTSLTALSSRAEA
jgi:hypothetical protein